MDFQIKVSIALATMLAASPAFAMSEADCTAAFAAADANKNGALSKAEGASYFAVHRDRGKPIATTEIDNVTFMSFCKEGNYAAVTMDGTSAKVDPATADTSNANRDAGALLKGANSYTENQARERAATSGLTDVSDMTKDADGIWRGTAMKTGKKVNVAVDFKGNVVAN